MAHETAAVSARSEYTIQPCTMSLHAHSHTRKVHACLAVTCHLHFRQNDQYLLRATAVTRGCNGYRTKESAQKVDPGEAKFSRRSCRDSNPRPFNHESGTLTAELSPLPGCSGCFAVSVKLETNDNTPFHCFQRLNGISDNGY